MALGTTAGKVGGVIPVYLSGMKKGSVIESSVRPEEATAECCAQRDHRFVKMFQLVF